MKSVIHYILTLTTLCIALTNCEGEPELVYDYIVNNNSSQEIHLILYPYETIGNDSWLTYYNHYFSNNEFSYDVSYLGNEEKKFYVYPSQSISIKPGESIKFEYIKLDNHLTKNPETYGTTAIWLRKNCLKQILIGEDSEILNSELSYEYWSNSSNWIMQNESQYSIEYWLVIDDEVIREYGIADHQDH